MKRTELTKKTARNKGIVALGSTGVTMLLAYGLTPYFLVLGLPFILYFTYRWLQYRAKWGLKF